MHRYKSIVHIIIFLIIVGLSFQTAYNPFVINDSIELSEQVTKSADRLLQEIKENSHRYQEEPQDAYIDKVWKKTPGRNGLKINIEKSYEKMKAEGTFNEALLVFDEVKPKVTIYDLRAAPIYRGHPEKDMVAFLINVSWGDEHIPDILNILNEQQIKATFFIEGKWAKEHAELVKMIDEQGHIIGNHAYNHPDMAYMSKAESVEQIEQTNKIIKAIIDKDLKWFAPPSGSFSEDVLIAAEEQNMQTILWTIDTIDWKNPSVSVMMNRVQAKLHPGGTILMHPTAATVRSLQPIIKEIKKGGYRIGTIEQLLSEER
ncbi:polysaccharide deacetylase family protein [Virgibacillus sp. W0430]|uniref:polysaccharide deacetylase family protein n=1 Tax=Virgibacillus sp. W0430 TaxID=3391580 RepID=UPI003F44A655